MAALQQVLFAIGQSLGTLFLEPSLFASASATSTAGNSAGAELTLNITNSGFLNVRRVTNSFPAGITDDIIRQYNWLIGGSALLYSVRIRRNSGDTFLLGSDLSDSWLPMSQNRSWTLRSTSPPNFGSNINFTVEIALSNNLSNILSSGTFNFSCNASTFEVEP